MFNLISSPVSIIKGAAESLREGNLVAFATETVYGLGADAENKAAIERVYRVKNRPSSHPLIVHFSSIEYLYQWASTIPKYAIDLANFFWPGPLTLILPKTALAKSYITGGQGNIAVRVPSHPQALSILTEFEKLGGRGVAAPSANRFGKVSPTSFQDVQSELGKYLSKNDQIIDGGRCSIGLESTIIDCTKSMPTVLRPGAITYEMIQDLLDLKINHFNGSTNTIKASGLMKSHYSPSAKVILSGEPKPGDGFIALAEFPTPNKVIRLATPINSDEYARALYSALRLADDLKLTHVHILPPSENDIGAAIFDRIKKASYSDE